MAIPMALTARIFQSTQPKRAATFQLWLEKTGEVISIHAAQEGCDIKLRCPIRIPTLFQSTQPKRAATSCILRPSVLDINFNPRSPRGLRPVRNAPEVAQEIFQSTQPKRAATLLRLSLNDTLRLFQSTQPKRAATLQYLQQEIMRLISIHAAQEGCDSKFTSIYFVNWGISIHAAQEGCD